MTSDDDRIAYLAGDGPGALDDLDQAELDELKMLLADPSLWVEPDASLENAVVAAIEGEAVGATAPAPAPPPPPPPATSRAERRAQRRWLRPVATGVGVLAAAAAVVIGVIVVTADEVDNPDQFAIALPGGTADFEKFDEGWRVELNVAGLPRRDNGEFYEAWLRNADGVLVSIGTFNSGEDVTLWAGVSPRDFDTLTITRESADGDPASSGDRVLAVPITGN